MQESAPLRVIELLMFTQLLTVECVILCHTLHNNMYSIYEGERVSERHRSQYSTYKVHCYLGHMIETCVSAA